MKTEGTVEVGVGVGGFWVGGPAAAATHKNELCEISTHLTFTCKVSGSPQPQFESHVV